jgi:hypothetical protein
MGQNRSALTGSFEWSFKRAQWALGKLKALPTAMRAVLICIAVLAVFSVTNLVYQIVHKPTEVFALIPGESNKAPIETWRQYAPLFREYSTTSLSPELLAALAQVESAGNPIARTYWRWSLTSDPFAVYQPASSAVGMYQMTDAALSEAQGYCILHHTVVGTGCSATLLHSRVVPRHRACGGVLGPEHRNDSWPPPKDENRPSAKGGVGHGHSSVWHRTSDGIRAPRVPPHAQGALR